MTAPLRALLGQAATVGLLVGLLGAVGWRHATPRRFVIGNPPAVAPGQTGFMFWGGLRYVDGPRWLPEVLVLPVVGVAASVVAVLVCWVALRSRTGRFVSSAGVAVPAVVTGVAVAVATIIATRADSADVLVRIDRGASAGEGDLVSGDPWTVDLTPIDVWFPIIGVICAVLFAVGIDFAHRSVLTRSAVGQRRRR